ncbi:FixH family protein [Streptomyces abyssomicinicus]|uniref:FixH family protein n=1 Tax=Streptomyces abyssomicinicus TaxID=574929 RepID=UPI0012508FE3|nr:FixH family protein [Streptomyces abyssomicinicus]
MTRRTDTRQPAGTDLTATPAGARTPRGPMRRAASPGAVVLAAALLAACGPSTDTGAAAPAATSDLDKNCRATKSDAGLEVTLAVAPCPVKGGGAAGTADITVKDAAGQPVEGAKVEINPEMPNMKMKGGDQTARPEGEGYQAKLVLGMPGDWKITVQVRPGSGEASSTAFHLTAGE